MSKNSNLGITTSQKLKESQSTHQTVIINSSNDNQTETGSLNHDDCNLQREVENNSSKNNKDLSEHPFTDIQGNFSLFHTDNLQPVLCYVSFRYRLKGFSDKPF